MKGCRAWRKRFPEAIYGELDSATRAGLESHLASCGKCSALYSALAETAGRLNHRPAPEREPEFWDGYWDRLSRRMAGERETRRAPALAVPRWVLGAAGAALVLALGIFLGRTVFSPQAGMSPEGRVVSKGLPAAPPGIAPGAEPALAVRALRYLRRSRVILLAVVNSDPQTDDFFNLSLPLQKKSSEELAQEAAGLKKELRRSDPRLERLVSDLEMILLQIANLKPQADASAVEVIKAGIEDRDIFFKINLSEVRRSNDGSEGRRGPTGSSRKTQVKTSV